MDTQLLPVVKTSSRQDKRMFLKLINKFRAEYFTDADPMGMEDVNHALDNKVLCMFITVDKKCIGMVEATPGSVNDQKLLNIATIFVDKRYRGNGIANVVYSHLDNLLPEVDIALQIEESKYHVNVNQFANMGFTHYWAGELPNVQDHRKYDEKTFVLYQKEYEKGLQPILETA